MKNHEKHSLDRESTETIVIEKGLDILGIKVIDKI